MSEDISSPMTPLDSMISQDSLQILKASIPYMPEKSQQLVSIYAKTKELANTISLFRHPISELSMMSAKPEPSSPDEFLNEIRRFTSDSTKNNIDQILFALNTIQLIQMYQDQPEK
ncbi:MAG: hypothetical protein EOM40_09365 [Clostridia bacterium]|nr:hypothetical protein [Clostridia bacterium]NCC44896.1 hypothetical protein [Clostridia bacterium]